MARRSSQTFRRPRGRSRIRTRHIEYELGSSWRERALSLVPEAGKVSRIRRRGIDAASAGQTNPAFLLRLFALRLSTTRLIRFEGITEEPRVRWRSNSDLVSVLGLCISWELSAWAIGSWYNQLLRSTSLLKRVYKSRKKAFFLHSLDCQSPCRPRKKKQPRRRQSPIPTRRLKR